jgi:hypothetical protein
MPSPEEAIGESSYRVLYYIKNLAMAKWASLSAGKDVTHSTNPDRDNSR